MKPYEPWEFCNAENCSYYLDYCEHTRSGIFCPNCKVFRFHSYLTANNQILEPGSELVRLIELKDLMLERRWIYKEWNNKLDPNYDEIRNYLDTLSDKERKINEILSRLEESKWL